MGIIMLCGQLPLCHAHLRRMEGNAPLGDAPMNFGYIGLTPKVTTVEMSGPRDGVQSVYVVDSVGSGDGEKIGEVKPSGNGLWAATDLQGRNHGDRYISAFAAANQLRLGLRKSLKTKQDSGSRRRGRDRERR